MALNLANAAVLISMQTGSLMRGNQHYYALTSTFTFVFVLVLHELTSPSRQ